MSESTAIVYTRMPPEPNGFIHFGHIKAMLFDFEKHPNCRSYLRFDDTNPETEKEEYVESIIQDVVWLGFRPWRISYTSDYFDQLYDYAVILIKNGSAYIDFTEHEEMKNMRNNGLESKYRAYPIDYHLEEFEKMRTGKYPENHVVLRLKIDMQNNNHALRDPIAYRVKYAPHYRTKTKYCIYPTYDYSHGIVDALEKITYSYCTMEFYIRRDQYYWPVDQLIKLGYDLKPAEVTEFGKLVVENNILSKRNIIKLVASGLVNGFDDPRLLTIAGLRRRGFTPTILKDIVKNATMARHDTIFSMPMIEYYLRKELNLTSPRLFAILDPIRINLLGDFTNVTQDCVHPNHPLDPQMGSHITKLSSNVFIDRSDFREVDDPNYYRLAPGKTIRLRYGPFIRYVSHRADNVICELAEPEKPKKIKGVIHWVSEEDSIACTFELYENILDEKGEFNEKSLIRLRGRVEKAVLLDISRVYQFERLGYFKFDNRYGDGGLPVFIRIIDLVDKYDGK